MTNSECTGKKLRSMNADNTSIVPGVIDNFSFHSGLCMIRQRLAQWQAIRGFRALDDQSLQDIGIERYEIRDFVLREVG